MESINISFSANRQTLTGGGLYCASNTVHYIIADFGLGDGWDGFDSVRAVWSNDFKCISTVLDPDGSCTVPHEVLARRGKVSVNLVGSILEDDELTDRLTTYPVMAITVDANAKICGTETAEVTPSQFEQYVQIVKDEVAKVKDIDRAELNEDYTLTFYFSDGTETTVGPIRGEQGETGNGIESAVLNDNYTLTLTFTDGTEYTTPSIRGEQGEQGEPGEVTLAQLSSVLPTDTASGAIASFPDGSDLFDYLSCIVDIDPVQDLHGYSSPWVGGAGKNLIAPSAWNSSFYTQNADGTVNCTGVDWRGWTTDVLPVNGIPIFAGTYTVSTNVALQYMHSEAESATTISANSTSTFTISANAVIGFKITSVVNNAKIQLETGSTATSWTPWENLCPITGWTGCEVDVSGVNIWDEEVESGYINVDDGTNAPDNSRYRCKNYISVRPNTDYYFKAPNHAVANNVVHRLYYYDADKNFIASPSGIYASHIFTTPANAYYVRFFVNEAVSNFDSTLSVNYPSTDTTYHAYNGTTYSVSWQTEAGTVYGGTVDLATGVLTVDRAIVDLGSRTWAKESDGVFYSDITSLLPKRQANTALVSNVTCSAYVAKSVNNVQMSKSGVGYYTYSGNGHTYLYIGDSRYSTGADLKQALNGVQLVYELATPITYQLDPVQVECLLGQNNVWADCGDIEKVKYKADVQKWVEKKLGE